MTEPRPRLVLVRHGETGWSREGRHTGRTDVELVPSGRLQAAAVGERLAGLSFEMVLTSPSTRAVETCRLAGFGERAVPTDDLLEWDYGDDEGRTTSEIRELRPGWTLWADGVPNGETAADVGRRADRVVERARAAGGDTLCFAHGHILRVLAARWVGLPAIGGRLFLLGTGSSGVLGWEREAPVIQRWNEPAREVR
ncbi:MAG TPA: histidine phosphatase family protein [Acidimicrobiales bacterium]|nr:histidine phosphatase family protein [Acidimicrobiales bacterium]